MSFVSIPTNSILIYNPTLFSVDADTKEMTLEIEAEPADIDLILPEDSTLFDSTISLPPIAETAAKTDAVSKKRKLNTIRKKSAKKPKLSGRKVESNTKAPCILQTDEVKAVGGCDDASLRSHAYLRIQIFALMTIAFFGMATRSDPLKNRQISMQILSAYLQVGKATHANKYKYHAAHYNGGAGLRDDLRNTMIQEIITELALSPQKERFLKSKGFNEADLKFITDNISDPDKINELFNKIWPYALSIVYDTETDLSANGTTEVPVGVNLACDKGLETVIRPLIVELLQEIALEKLPPATEPAYKCEQVIKVCEKFHLAITQFFTNREKELKDHLILIGDYQTKLLKFENYTTLTQDEISTNLSELHELAKVLMPIKKKKNKATDDKVKNVAASKLRTKIKMNKKFANNSLHGLKTNKTDPLTIFKIWMLKKYDLLKSEVSDNVQKVESYLKYITLELKGTQLYRDDDYDFFKSLFHTESVSIIQERLWKPIPKSPTKPIAAKRFSCSDFAPKMLDFEMEIHSIA